VHNKVWYFPLEDIEARDYRMFDRQMIEAFEYHNMDYEKIEVDVKANFIKDGWVMDGPTHAIFCISQAKIFIEKMMKGEVQNGDILFFNDMWHFGLHPIQYAAQLSNIELKYAGYIHAGTFTKYDFAEPMKWWAENMEKSFFKLANLIFVATKQPYNDIVENGLIKDSQKIKVVSHPFDIKVFEKYKNIQKENIVIFPHRLDPDKRPEEFLDLAEKMPNYKFIMTSGGKDIKNYPHLQLKIQLLGNVEIYNNLTKDEYYKIMAKCKVMFSSAVQENWGVATYEAIHLGLIPICPWRCSYPYYLPVSCLYTDRQVEYDVVPMIERIFTDSQRYDYILNKLGERKDKGNSAKLMVKYLKTL